MKLLDPSAEVEELMKCGHEEVDDDERTETGLLDQNRLRLDRTMLNQTYQLFLEKGGNGMTQAEVGMTMGMSGGGSKSVLFP